MIGSIKSWLGNRSQFQWLTFLFFTAALLCVAGIWFASHRSLDKKLNAIRAQGLPTNLGELNDYYSIPEGVFDSTELWLTAYKALETADVETKGKDLPFVGNGDTPKPGQEWAEFSGAKDFIDSLDTELELIYQAAKAGGQIRYPTVFSGLDFDTSPLLQESRGVARLLSLAAHVHARNGDCDSAYEDVKATFSLANALDGEVSIIAVLIKNAILATGTTQIEEILPLCQWNDDQLLRLQQLIMQPDFHAEMIRAVNGERAYVLSGIDQFPLILLKTINKHSALDFFEKFIQTTSDLPWSEVLDFIDLLDQEIGKQASTKLGAMKSIGVTLLVGSFNSFVTATLRTITRARCLNAALATKRYQLKHGKLPQSLEEIPHELFTTGESIEDQLSDPFDGQPLRYQIDSADASRLLIYGIGEDQQDDGGDCPREEDSRPLDLGFWLNTKR